MTTMSSRSQLQILASLLGCATSSRGVGGFTIAVPALNTEVKQGHLQTVVVALRGDALFMEDVKLEVKAAMGIGVEPAVATIKAGNTPHVQFRITAARDAAPGEYPVVVAGTPKTGEATSVGFTVKIVGP